MDFSALTGVLFGLAIFFLLVRMPLRYWWFGLVGSIALAVAALTGAFTTGLVFPAFPNAMWWGAITGPILFIAFAVWKRNA